MCFSAEASFIGGILISGIGITTLRKVHKPSQLIFASIPLFFGIQQLTEGFLWLALPYPDQVLKQKLFTYIFLILADVVWPTMIPLSVLFMEDSKKRKRVLWVLLGMGVTVSLYYIFCLLSYGVHPRIAGYHIKYNNGFPDTLGYIVFFIYVIATIVPLFISSIKKTHLMGILMFGSCFVTAILYTQYLTSVWCFFAALLSGVIYWILNDSMKAFNFTKLEELKNQIKTISGL